MDFLFLEKITEELNRHLKKKRIREIYQGNSSISLNLNGEFLNFFYGNPNAFFISENGIADKPLNAVSFIKGAYVKEFYLPKKDRVIFVETVKLLPSGRPVRFFLVFEVTGKNANFLVLNEKREILFASRKAETSVRNIQKGEKYEYPPSNKLPFSRLNFGKVTKEGIEKNLFKYVEGLSPLNSKEIAELFSKSGDLGEAYKTFMELHQKSNEAFLYFENGKSKYLTTFPYSSLSELNFKKFSGKKPFSRAWEEYYRQNVELKREEDLKKRALEKLEKKLKSLKEERDRLSNTKLLESEAKKYKKWGELLKYNLHLVKPGSKEISVYDYETGREVKIPLNPSLSPQKNLLEIFKTYRKYVRKLEFSKNRLAELNEKIRELERLKENLNAEETVSEGTGETAGKAPFLTFVLPSGRKILVWKNSKANEFLSLKLANPWDFWFHAKNVPGSHVILRLSKGEKASEEDLILSASAAAFFSKGKLSGKIPVDYTEVKNVRKPKGSPTGKVIYRKEKTLMVSPDEFKRLLEEGDLKEIPS
jgi:predicted ribosome quality control (RQC) complex YloA/Tae2 family protein